MMTLLFHESAMHAERNQNVQSLSETVFFFNFKIFVLVKVVIE